MSNYPTDTSVKQGGGMVIRDEGEFLVVYIHTHGRTAILDPRRVAGNFKLGAVLTSVLMRPIPLDPRTMDIPFEILSVVRVDDPVNLVKIVGNKCLSLLSFDLAVPDERFKWWTKLCGQYVLKSNQVGCVTMDQKVIYEGVSRQSVDVAEKHDYDPNAIELCGWCEFQYAHVPAGVVGGDPKSQAEVWGWCWVVKEIEGRWWDYSYEKAAEQAKNLGENQRTIEKEDDIARQKRLAHSEGERMNYENQRLQARQAAQQEQHQYYQQQPQSQQGQYYQQSNWSRADQWRQEQSRQEQWGQDQWRDDRLRAGPCPPPQQQQQYYQAPPQQGPHQHQQYHQEQNWSQAGSAPRHGHQQPQYYQDDRFRFRPNPPPQQHQQQYYQAPPQQVPHQHYHQEQDRRQGGPASAQKYGKHVDDLADDMSNLKMKDQAEPEYQKPQDFHNQGKRLQDFHNKGSALNSPSAETAEQHGFEFVRKSVSLEDLVDPEDSVSNRPTPPASTISRSGKSEVDALRARSEALRKEAERAKAAVDAAEAAEVMALLTTCEKSLRAFWGNPELRTILKKHDFTKFVDVENFINALPKVRRGEARFKSE